MDELRARLQGGNHEFLRHVDYRTVDVREALRLGSDAPYYLSVVYRTLDMPDMELRMVELGSRASAGLWRDESELRHIEILLERRSYEEALRRTGAASRRITGDERTTRLRRLRLEALYYLGRARELLQLLDVHLAKAPALSDPRRDDPDLVLYGAVGAALLERPEWEDLFRDLAWNYRASAAHSRALVFLQGSSGRRAQFSSAEIDLFRGKAALAEQRSDAAVSLLSASLRALPAPPGSVAVEEAGRLYLALGRYREGLQLLGGLAEPVAEPWVVDEFRGRLFEAASAPAEAALALETAVRTSPDPGQRQRALWRFLNLRINSGEKELGRLFYNRRERIADATYYSDLLEEAVTSLLGARNWSELEVMRDFVREKNVGETLARVDFILARAVSSGILSPASSRDPGALLDEAIAAAPYSYYALLAGLLRGKPFQRLACDDGSGEPRDPSLPDSLTRAQPPASFAADAPRQGGVEAFVAGYFRFGLPRHGYNAVLQLAEAAPIDAVTEAARQLQAAGLYDESLRLVSGLSRRVGYCLPRRLLLLLYPALYISDVERLAEEQDLNVPVVLAVVREESSFNPAVVSLAGAVGLTQLMPSTAEEVAARLGLDRMDLKDPIVNLRIGLRHLAGLRSSTGSLSKTVIAYNAGLGRLRSWERELKRLPGELFVEAVPYEETRFYARQVLLAAVMYGWLYQGAPPAATVEQFFPGYLPAGPS